MAKHPHVQSVYLPEWMLADLRVERRRLERNNAWLVQRAWELAKKTIRSSPAAPREPCEFREPSPPSSEAP